MDYELNISEDVLEKRIVHEILPMSIPARDDLKAIFEYILA
jgi:hypothetical protein